MARSWKDGYFLTVMNEDSPRETGQEQQEAAITEVREITPEVVEIAEIALGKIKK